MSAARRSDLDAALGFAVSDEQWAVIASPLEPAVVVAGAGSGKTTAMAARIAYLVASGEVSADAVLGLTFTTKAAASLLATTRTHIGGLRAAGLIAETDDDEHRGEPQILTYNAFAARLLREHGIRLGREPGAQVLTDGARQQLAYRVVCRSGLPLHEAESSPVTLTGDLLQLDDQLSELDIDPQLLVDDETAAIAELSSLAKPQVIAKEMLATARTRRLLAQLVIEWRAEKAVRGVLDFTDQTRLALQIVRRFPEVAAEVRSRIDVVLLDEYQDTSLAQRALLQALFGDGHPVTAVGDPCQAIYGWRGASVDNIEHFDEHFPVMRNGRPRPSARFTLRSNRRSGPAILAVANEVSTSLRGRHRGVEALEAAATDKGAGIVRVGLFETSTDEKAWVVEQVLAHRPTGDQTWSDTAILASTGRDLVELDAALRARGVPTQLYGAAGLLRQPVIVEVRSMLEVLHDPIANPAMVRLLSGPRWRIGPRDLAALGRRAGELTGPAGRQEAADIHEALDQAIAGTDPVETVSLSDAVLDLGPAERYSPEALERLQRFAAELRELRRHAGEPMTELIARIGQVTGLEIEMALSADPEQQRSAWSSFLDLAAGFDDLDGGATLGAFLSRLRDAERFDIELPVDVTRQRDAVQLLTVHKAKGLEYSRVFVVSLAKGAFPGGMARGEWPKTASAVPWRLRADTNELLDSFPDPDGPKAKDYTAYRAVLRDLADADAERLAYVALTRAKHALVVTGHWWGPTQTKPRGPQPHLRLVREAVDEIGGEVVVWHPAPEDDAANPSPRAVADDVPWPAPITSASRLAEAASMVRERMGDDVLPGMPTSTVGLSPAECEQVERWASDSALLLDEQRRRRQPVVHVPLPDSLSATAAIAAMRDPEAFAIGLARPMPSAPAPAARRGIAFHAWVESRFGQQSLLDPDDLPGAGDADITSDARLIELQAAFERTPYARREPVAIEEPFTLVIGGRVVRGRIDAVFADGDRFEVVDWKTGGTASTDPLQLAIYRVAWAQARGVPLDRVDGAFVLVASGEVVRPQELPGLDEIAAMLGGAD